MKLSKKIIAALLCMVIMLGSFAMVGSAQAALSAGSENTVVQNVTQLESGAQYRIRNAGSGKYLQVGINNVFQDEYDPDCSGQIITYYGTAANCEFVSDGKNITVLLVGRAYSAVPSSVNPSTQRKYWTVENIGSNGAMQIINNESMGGWNGPALAANGDGVADIFSRDTMTYLGEGTIYVNSRDYFQSYQQWYFEKVN